MLAAGKAPRSPSAFTAVSSRKEPAPPTPPKEREKRDSLLCDGDTEEGPSWVEPWIRENNEAAQLIFHCVQIGRRGDGTLKRLAELTGGQFLRVEG